MCTVSVSWPDSSYYENWPGPNSISRVCFNRNGTLKRVAWDFLKSQSPVSSIGHCSILATYFVQLFPFIHLYSRLFKFKRKKNTFIFNEHIIKILYIILLSTYILFVNINIASKTTNMLIREKASDQFYDENPLYQQEIPKSNVKTLKRFQNHLLHSDRTCSWGIESHPIDVVKPGYSMPTFPLTAKAVLSKGPTFKNLYTILLIKTENEQPTQAQRS